MMGGWGRADYGYAAVPSMRQKHDHLGRRGLRPSHPLFAIYFGPITIRP